MRLFLLVLVIGFFCCNWINKECKVWLIYVTPSTETQLSIMDTKILIYISSESTKQIPLIFILKDTQMFVFCLKIQTRGIAWVHFEEIHSKIHVFVMLNRVSVDGVTIIFYKCFTNSWYCQYCVSNKSGFCILIVWNLDGFG